MTMLWGCQDGGDTDPGLRVSILLEDINVCLQIIDLSMIK